MTRAPLAHCLLLSANLLLAACTSLSAEIPATQPATNTRPAPAAHELRAMTLNIRYPAPDDGPDSWPLRRNCVGQLLAAEAPDVVGLQEAFLLQVQALHEDLPELAWLGRSRYGNSENEHTAILYRRERLELLDSGDFWLSDTPDVVASITWGNALPRMVTWADFRDRRSGQRLHVINTHYPWRSQDADARERSSRLILAHIQALPVELPILLLGDFNTTPGTPPHAIFRHGGLEDAWLQAAERSGPEGTWHAFKGVPQTRIDWILSRGFVAEQVQTIDEACAHGRWPSDHFPVSATLRWVRPAATR